MSAVLLSVCLLACLFCLSVPLVACSRQGRRLHCVFVCALVSLSLLVPVCQAGQQSAPSPSPSSLSAEHQSSPRAVPSFYLLQVQPERERRSRDHPESVTSTNRPQPFRRHSPLGNPNRNINQGQRIRPSHHFSPLSPLPPPLSARHVVVQG